MVAAQTPCTGPLADRSTSFDWVRYFWALATTSTVSLPEFWALWDGANPYSWNGDGTGSSADFPPDRLGTSAVGVGITGEHAAAAVHGLGH